MLQIMLLLLLILIPLLGAIIGAFLNDAKIARTWALLVAIATFVVGVMLIPQFDFHQQPTSMEDSVQVKFGYANNSFSIQSPVAFSFKLGADTISLWLILLTVFLQPLAVAASFESIKDRAKEYYAWMTLLLMAMLGCFIARDVLLFYIFFELTLIPMFFIIGIWGGPERRYAAGKFFLFTFAGSVFTLAGVVYLGLMAKGFDLGSAITFAQLHMTQVERFWLVLGLLAGFS